MSLQTAGRKFLPLCKIPQRIFEVAEVFTPAITKPLPADGGLFPSICRRSFVSVPMESEAGTRLVGGGYEEARKKRKSQFGYLTQRTYERCRQGSWVQSSVKRSERLPAGSSRAMRGTEPGTRRLPSCIPLFFAYICP